MTRLPFLSAALAAKHRAAVAAVRAEKPHARGFPLHQDDHGGAALDGRAKRAYLLALLSISHAPSGMGTLLVDTRICRIVCC